jgi:hypothetical protein
MSPPAAEQSITAARLAASGEVAQLVEHTAENRGVVGSSPTLAILCSASATASDRRRAARRGELKTRQRKAFRHNQKLETVSVVSHTATCDHEGIHDHAAEHEAHDHSHGLVDRSIIRSRAGIRAVSWSLAILTVTALAQAFIYTRTLSVALLADLIHNFGDALTAIPLGLAFFFRSARGERLAGLAVVLAIFVSALVALGQTIERFVHPRTLTHLWLLAAAGIIGFVGNEIAAQVRHRTHHRSRRGATSGVFRSSGTVSARPHFNATLFAACAVFPTASVASTSSWTTRVFLDALTRNVVVMVPAGARPAL